MNYWIMLFIYECDCSLPLFYHSKSIFQRHNKQICLVYLHIILYAERQAESSEPQFSEVSGVTLPNSQADVPTAWTNCKYEKQKCGRKVQLGANQMIVFWISQNINYKLIYMNDKRHFRSDIYSHLTLCW